MSEKIVLVTGGRDYDDHAAIAAALDDELPIDLLLHGGAGGWRMTPDGRQRHYGADHLAGIWATINGVSVTVYPADWRTYGRGAGPLRNRAMADRLAQYRQRGCDVLVLAFPGGDGTANMVAEARKRGLPVKEKRHDRAGRGPAGAGRFERRSAHGVHAADVRGDDGRRAR